MIRHGSAGYHQSLSSMRKIYNAMYKIQVYVFLKTIHELGVQQKVPFSQRW